MLRAISIPWRELAAIEFKGVDSVAISDMYYQLVFQRHDGSRVTAEAPGGGARPGEYLFELPGGGARPGEYLFELRERLLAMRYTATWPLLDASNPTTPTETPPTTATWPLLEEPALPPAATGQSTDRPARPRVSGAILSAWAEWPTRRGSRPPPFSCRAMPQLRWTPLWAHMCRCFEARRWRSRPNMCSKAAACPAGARRAITSIKCAVCVIRTRGRRR
jgi:hypothetical protein